ncbi:MAG TPA: hypothetical protein VK925_12725 [Jiangellaceae bacterium]|nr:hypothetical protein [Jiangellaceae bacterium]
MRRPERERRELVLRAAELRARRRATGRAGRRAAALRAAAALRFAASTGPRT